MHIKLVNDNAAYRAYLSSLAPLGPDNIAGSGKVRTCLLHHNLHIWRSRNLAGAGICWERANGFLHSAK